MGIEQHLVALRRVRLHDKCTAEAQFEVGEQNLARDAADYDLFLAPVELVRLARLELQRHEGLDNGSTAAFPPASDEFGDAAIVTLKPQSLQLGVKLQCGAPLTLLAPGIGFQHLQQSPGVWHDLAVPAPPAVLRLNTFRRIEPLPHRLARQARAPLNFRQRQPVAIIQTPYFTQ